MDGMDGRNGLARARRRDCWCPPAYPAPVITGGGAGPRRDGGRGRAGGGAGMNRSHIPMGPAASPRKPRRRPSASSRCSRAIIWVGTILCATVMFMAAPTRRPTRRN